jgi:hypothetical protein
MKRLKAGDKNLIFDMTLRLYPFAPLPLYPSSPLPLYTFLRLAFDHANLSKQQGEFV